MSTVTQTKRKPSGAAAMGAGPGRPKGSSNKTTTVLKDAILLAATSVGEDGKGKNGLTGYLILLAKAQPKAFATLLGRVLPMQITGTDDGPLVVHLSPFTSPEEQQAWRDKRNG